MKNLLELFLNNSKYIILVLGIVVGTPLLWARRDRVGFKSFAGALGTCFLFCLYSLIGAIGLAAIEDIILGRTPSFGATYLSGVYLITPFFLFGTAKLFKWKSSAIFDLYTVYAIPAMFLMRCNCLIAGCCIGRPFFSTGLRWPTREMELIFYVIMFVIILRREKQAREGTAFPLLMICYGLFRFVIEWVRESDITSLIHPAHVWALLTAVIGAAFYFELNRKRGKKH